MARSDLWRTNLAAMPSSDAVAWLKASLDSGEDAPTGADFVPGPNGWLTQAPTLRVAWLEELGRYDPVVAANYAEKMLATPTTPEEWAVALRELARGRPDARALLEAKTRVLLRHEEWRHDPTAAWLEAFDVAVHLGGASLLPELTGLARDQANRPASHAAFLALDRLVQNDAGSVLAVFLAEDRLLEGREAMRGNLFARADVGDSAQRRVVEEYLLAPARAPAELEAFADVFPNANYHLSANLLTVSRPLDASVQQARDTAALAAVREWRKDARFAALDRHLFRIQARLEEFVGR
jgi:hypothetical protein